ncbi:hypothetical protein RhiirA4_529109 [Rhizophagus irregularis]|uniref:Uncharacterized protein n=1 Tax=Rhizophagus irregularis TaxID=588596 RepID=A0A2I1GTI5_9GLOM|nr:hypothetical protein RhiirA4_529109 [Rhizophagus irregularis]
MEESQGYNFLKDHITLTNTGRLNIGLGQELVQNPKVQRPKPPPVKDEPISHQGRPNGLHHGLLPLKTSHMENFSRQHTSPILYAEHWISKQIDTMDQNLAPRKTQFYLVKVVPCIIPNILVR